MGSRLVSRTAPWLLLAAVLNLPAVGSAGGTGVSTLLVVNPNDENALRIANAYAALRGIPDNNIVFIAPPQTNGFTKWDLSSKQEAIDTYINPLRKILVDRNLSTQIDYIGTVGESTRYPYATTAYDTRQGVNYALGLLHVFPAIDTDQAGGAVSAVSDARVSSTSTTIAVNTNAAIHSDESYLANYGSGMRHESRYLMSGAIGYTGVRGNAPGQVIASLERAAAADGTRPVGTVYFEENADIRSTTREPYFPDAQAELTARGVNNVLETGVTPVNRNDVRGAVVGQATTPLPNGSTYIPGSWADNLTSFGMTWDDRGQTKATMFINAGAAATSGTIVEPYAIPNRFPSASIHAFIADGSTLGEAYTKSVRTPDVLMFAGDLLAQPYADVPTVAITSGPANGGTVTGTLGVSAAGSLSTPVLATAVKQLDLYIDGRRIGTVSGDSGSFNYDTRLLADGYHELRVVATNNAAAESQGQLIRQFVVNNRGFSVTAGSGTVDLTATQTGAIDVASQHGPNRVDKIELRVLGRVVGEVRGDSGQVMLQATRLAYGENRVVPVAVFANGMEIAGEAITVRRNFDIVPGQTPSAVGDRTAGIKAEYFLGKGALTIAGSDFSGTPDINTNHSRMNLRATAASNLGDVSSSVLALSTTQTDKLAIRLSGKFNLNEAGEYQFFSWRSNDSIQVLVDGQKVLGVDNQQYGFTPNNVEGIYLGVGEHDLTVLASNVAVAGQNDAYFDISVEYRGPDGVMRVVDSAFLYQVAGSAMMAGGSSMMGASSLAGEGTLAGGPGDLAAVPEPGPLAALAGMGVVAAVGYCWRRQRAARRPAGD